ncbi:YafY family protein [Tistrella bauzanensis]|uniref:YafY family protein n=1 Tax=Tistrella arctica TaxID=3133430 RepID=A0ABU9YDP6_9PROT
MRRADRLFAILQALRGGRLRTADQLAGMLEVSTRTIYRDLADLQGQGVPIDGERGVGYLLRDGFFLPPLALSALELEALTWGVALVRAHADESLAAAARELEVKLKAAVSTAGSLPPATVAAYGFRVSAADRDRLRMAREAIAGRRVLALTYADAADRPSVRQIRPLELQHWGAVWTLTGWCELRGDFRVFRIDRIRSMTDTGTRFRDEPGKRLADYLRSLKPPPDGC